MFLHLPELPELAEMVRAAVAAVPEALRDILMIASTAAVTLIREAELQVRVVVVVMVVPAVMEQPVRPEHLAWSVILTEVH